MNRIDLIIRIFRIFDFDTYLEIGTRSGNSFFPVRCKNKLAVDPAFRIPWEKKVLWMIRNPRNLTARYFRKTSNDFFEQHGDLLRNLDGPDVVLVDGLHTFRASLQDVLNALKYLNPEGFIVVHDCHPPHEAAALPTGEYPSPEERNIPGWDGTWNGDVWKNIVYLRTHLSDYLDIRVLDTDHGLGVIRIKDRAKRTPEDALVIREEAFEEIDRLTYAEMNPRAEELLNLVTAESILPLLEDLKAKRVA